jgi:Dolichyl-phosphate-mannose-protein mannosyltransferase
MPVTVTGVATLDRPSADPPRASRSVVRSGALAPLALVLLAAVIRLPTLAQQSFWLDEGYTVRLVRMSFGGMLHEIPITESTPPVYYAAAWVWTRLFGSSEFGLRSLSAVAGILTVVVVYFIGVRIAGRTAGVIAGVLVALSPLMVWYSQEARAYALATLLSTITILCFVAFLQGRDERWLAGWAVSSALGLATHYFVAFVVAPELVWLAWRFSRDRRVLGAVALVVAVGVALVPLARDQSATGHADYIAVGGLATRILQVPKQFLIGYASPAQVATGAVAAVLVLCGGVWALVTVARGGAWGDGGGAWGDGGGAWGDGGGAWGDGGGAWGDGGGAWGDGGGSGRWRERAVLIPLGLGIVALVLTALLALAGIDFLNTRNLLPALPPLLLVVACGFAALGAGGATGAAVARPEAPEGVAMGRSGGASPAAAGEAAGSALAPSDTPGSGGTRSGGGLSGGTRSGGGLSGGTRSGGGLSGGTRPAGPRRVAPAWAGLLAAGALGLVFVVVLLLVDTDPQYQRADWRGVSQALGAATVRRAIVVTPASGVIPLTIYQPGLTQLRGPTSISELDVVAGPNNQSGQRIGAPPRPGARPPVPPGFTLYDSTFASTYSVIRYRATQPKTVQLSTLLSERLTIGGGVIVLEQSP